MQCSLLAQMSIVPSMQSINSGSSDDDIRESFSAKGVATSVHVNTVANGASPAAANGVTNGHATHIAPGQELNITDFLRGKTYLCVLQPTIAPTGPPTELHTCLSSLFGIPKPQPGSQNDSSSPPILQP